ncbi:hypothetical protein RF11_05333 [Thelohanellus kitauei]|uniref:Integrase zinc-binding domain-containing protein n=1 Tax=Thelohanellus kitauei TaxID=669202 RepID=A0A0C2IPJ8_THEKT|nr:hypothetical protein RF11_05333 [Thelohanellus kitauei]
MNDSILSEVLFWIQNGWPDIKTDSKFYFYYSIREFLSVKDSTLIMNRSWPRVVIPTLLHKGHCGSSRMINLAREYCYWHNIDKDIDELSKSCIPCRENAKLGLPETTVSDNGKQFMSAEFANFSNRENIKRAERFVQTFKSSINKQMADGKHLDEADF